MQDLNETTTAADETANQSGPTMYPLEGPFAIGVEGIDCCGKNLVCEIIEEILTEYQIPSVTFADLDATAVGKQVRQMYLHDDEKPTPDTELLLIAAARNENIARNIDPAFQAGKFVIMNRTPLSTMVYQCMVKGASISKLDLVNAMLYGSSGVMSPRYTLLIDRPLEACLESMKNKPNADAHETKGADWFSAVATGYDQMRRINPGHYIVVNNHGTVDDLRKTLRGVVQHLHRTLNTIGFLTNDHLDVVTKMQSSAIDQVIAKAKAAGETIPVVQLEEDSFEVEANDTDPVNTLGKITENYMTNRQMDVSAATLAQAVETNSNEIARG